MFRHIVFTRFENPAEQVPVAREMLLKLPAIIPEIVTMEVGADELHEARSFDMALTVTFNKKQDLPVYANHPEHVKVREYIGSHARASAAVDYEF